MTRLLSADEKMELSVELKDSGYKGGVGFDQPLAGYTTMRIGGPANVFLQPTSTPDVCEAIKVLNAREMKWDVLGGGSNILFPDYGYMGALIKFGRGMSEFRDDDDLLHAGAGMSTSRLMNYALSDGYGGVDFLVGIPGTIGGAMALNAGTREQWIDSMVLWAEAVNREGNPIRCLKPKGGYREGILSGRGYIFTAVALRREDADPSEIRSLMKERMKNKVEAQPYGERSAGSVFKNPEGKSAWELIDSIGLRGHKIGGASLSEKHCNFIVCEPETSSEHVRQLIDLARERVQEKHDIQLETEIVLMGFEMEPEVPIEEDEEVVEDVPDEGETGEMDEGESGEVDDGRQAAALSDVEETGENDQTVV